MSRKPNEKIDYITRDYDAFKELMIQKLKEKMPEYTDTSETDAGIVILEALANGLDILSLYLDIVANDVLLPTTQDRGIAVLLAKCLGYIPYSQTASEYEQVFVLEEKRGEDTLVPKGTVVRTEETSSLETLYFETQEDLIIPANSLGDEKDVGNNYIHKVRIKHGQTITQDVIGTSSGAPLQSFQLNYTQVLIDSIQLYVNEGKGNVLWKRVDNFVDSDENSLAYLVSVDDFDRCTISFGNGIKGKIPVSYANGITANYRVGGGEIGNVGEGVINTLDTNVPYIDTTFNLPVLVRGHEKESIDSIKLNAPAFFRTRDRLVTLQDYKDLLCIYFYDFLDLAIARDTNNKKLVHIYYMLREGYTMTPKLVNNLALFIADRSMIGTTYDINAFTPQQVNISASMFVDKDFEISKVKKQVEEYLKDEVFKYGNLLFEDKIIKSDLETLIKSKFNGVLSFRINTPTEDIIAPANLNNVLTLGTLDINSRHLA